MRRHRPAMLAEVLDVLRTPLGGVVVDATVGHGGHAEAIMETAGEEGRLIAFDWDSEMLRTAKRNLKDAPGQKRFVRADYRELPAWMDENEPRGAHAILLDLGVNLEHLDDPERGFSFAQDAPLDMRMDRESKETAAAWLGRASEGEIARALREYGGERWAGPIARQILKRRKESRMRRTSDLVEAVLSAVPPAKREKRIHPATRTFQAVRITVNRELEAMGEALQEIGLRLRVGGRMAVLSYHSGEDRAVKTAFKNLSARGEFRMLTKKPARPSASEIHANPHSRSAKLRAIERKVWSKEV